MALTALAHMPLFGKLGLLISLLPLFVGIWAVVRPSEQRLALMRPLSLAAIFSAIANLLLGMANGLHAMGTAERGAATGMPPAGVLLAEALLPSFVGFAFLTVAWLCVAVAMRRTA